MLVVDPNDLLIAAEITRLAGEQHINQAALSDASLQELDDFGTDIFRLGGRPALARWLNGLDAITGVALLQHALRHHQGDAVIQLRAFQGSNTAARLPALFVLDRPTA